ncbi:hypothetical protein [Mycobacterium sp. BK086]|uniref:hypothetical protein n=1 Tax=Mycobacterium sp. BK086 TaxID=2512165 RepID=UPI001AAC6B14|nr:hypothetical protein [Mycobacterium sp. BK086]
MRFSAPPGWPTPPAGWEPPPGWQADPSWPPPPAGWQFWVEDVKPQPQLLAGRHGLIDAGRTLITLSGDRADVAAEVDRARHPDGSVHCVDFAAYRKYKDGPLNALRVLLEDEACTVSVWAESGFGAFQKRSASKQVEQVCLNEGLDAAIDWALNNATNNRLDVEVLRSMFKSTFDGDATGHALLTIVERSVRNSR